MRFTLFAALGVAVTMLAGCDDDGDVIVAPDRPRAAVRFINAVPDTLVTDWRFIDQLELSPYEVGFAFRQMTDYQGVAPGSRPFKIFPGTNNVVTTQNALIDQAVVFTANQSYTLIHTGFSRTGRTPAHQLLVMTDNPPTPAANQIAVRAMHLGAGIGPVDVYISRSGGATPLPSTATFTNLTYGNASDYVTMEALPRTAGPLSATRTGYSRATGSFATDGFDVGDQIFVSGYGLPQNDGRSIVNAIRETRTTGAASLGASTTGFTRTTGSFVDDGIVAGAWITVTGFAAPENNGRFLVTAVTPTAVTVAGTTGSISLAATTSGYTRATGSFLTDGFYVGMPVTATGFGEADNNGASTVTDVTATELKVAKSPATVAEDSASGRTISRTPSTVVEAAAAGRTITQDAALIVTKTGNMSPQTPGNRLIVGELVFRAIDVAGDTLVGEWTAPPGDPANPAANLQALGGSTMGGSAIMGLLVPRSVLGSSAPQTNATANPPTPGFRVPTWIFAIDRHPR